MVFDFKLVDKVENVILFLPKGNSEEVADLTLLDKVIKEKLL